MKMNLRTWLEVLCCSACLLAASCGGGGVSVTDCPSYIVVPDSGATGFSSVGEWRTDAVCAQYCEVGYPVCQLVTATSVKCQRACA